MPTTERGIFDKTTSEEDGRIGKRITLEIDAADEATAKKIAEEAAENIMKATKNSNRFEIHFPFKLSTFLMALRLMPYRISLALTKKMLPK